LRIGDQLLEAALNVDANVDEAVKNLHKDIINHYVGQARDKDFFENSIDKLSTYVTKKKEQVLQNPVGGWFGYNYIGPGTKFNAQTPINKLDQIGRLHDMDYRFAHREPNIEKRNKNLIQADENMLKRMQKIPLNEKDNFHNFVKHVMTLKVNLTKAGLLPADLFVNKGESKRLKYLLPPTTPAESKKTNIISRLINQKLSERRMKEAEKESAEQKKPTENSVFVTPQKPREKETLTSFIINKTSDPTSSLLTKHYDNVTSHKKNVDDAVASNSKAQVFMELGSEQHYPSLLVDAQSKNGSEGVMSLAQHYSNNLKNLQQELEHSMASSGITALSENEMLQLNPSNAYLKDNFTEIPATANKKLPSLFSPRKTRKKSSVDYNPAPQYYRP
jgi:hypothetical protein